MTLLDKVDFLLTIAKKGSASDEELEEILKLTVEQSKHGRLGRVMGYSVSEYAIATLSWLGETKLFDEMMLGKDLTFSQNVSKLIKWEPYKDTLK